MALRNRMGNPIFAFLSPPFLLLLFAAKASAFAEAESKPGASSPRQAYFKVEAVVIPLSQGLHRNAPILGFARSGETYPVLGLQGRDLGWVHIQTSKGSPAFIPLTSGRFTVKDGRQRSPLPLLIGALLGLVGGGLSMAALLRWLQHRKGQLETRRMLATARSRRGKRILAVLHEWPEVHQTLHGDSRPMPSLLREWGYALANVANPDAVLEKGRSLQPNVVLALSQYARELEGLLAKDAALANTPVIYLGEKPPLLSEGHSVRLHWALGGSDKALSEVLAIALRRSPKTIRHGVRTEGIRGELVGGGLWEVLHFLATLRKTGTLQVETVNLKAEIRMAKGEILFAHMGDLADSEAVLGMLDLDEGRFAFVESQGPSQGKGLNTEKLLLDWARHRDEIHDGSGT